MQWLRNLFLVPLGKTGEQLVAEFARLVDTFVVGGRGLPYAWIAVVVACHILHQKPNDSVLIRLVRSESSGGVLAMDELMMGEMARLCATLFLRNIRWQPSLLMRCCWTYPSQCQLMPSSKKKNTLELIIKESWPENPAIM